MKAEEKAKKICDFLEEKKGRDIHLVNVEKQTSLCEYFVLASGGSSTQVRALYNNVDEKMEELGFVIIHRDTYADAKWAVMDYGDVIVHIFSDEMREFYDLERLWENDTNTVKIN